MDEKRRQFDSKLGDRVCRKPGMYTDGTTSAATKDFTEAFIYALTRAEATGKRQKLERAAKHGWWLTVCLEDEVTHA